MTRVIRNATHADIPGIAEIWNPLIRNTDITFTSLEKSNADLSAYLRDHAIAGDSVMVLLIDGQIAGFGSFKAFRGGPGYARSREVTISLAPGARGMGHGKMLLRTLENKANARGIHVLVAAITETNSSSQRFFSSQGYAIVGRMPQVGWKFDRWHNLVLMQKIL